MLYPNPTDGILNVEFSDTKNIKSVFVIDELGKIFKHNGNIKSGEMQRIDLSGKSSGVYFIRLIMDDNSIINKKVILK